MKILNFFGVVFLVALFSNFSSALTIEKVERIPVVVLELDNPAFYDLIIANNAGSEMIEIYSLVSVDILPSERLELPTGKTRFEITANPRDNLRRNSGYLNFEYEVKGTNSGIHKDKLLVNIIPLSEVFEIAFEPVRQSDDSVRVVLINKKNTRIENLEIEFVSEFFNSREIFSFEPFSSKSVDIEINRNKESLSAGSYIVDVKFLNSRGGIVQEEVLEYLEREGTSIESKTDGFIIKETTITKTNRGNVKTLSEISIRKNVFSRLFTINSPAPNRVERNGFFVTYYWTRELQPSESMEAKSTTNSTIPLIILVIVVFSGFAANTYFRKSLFAEKKVYPLRTKGGELALKVSLRVRARKNLTDVKITDHLPGTMKLYEKAGRLPDKYESSARRLQWNVGNLAKGQERIYSYVLYSNLKIVGRITLPRAGISFLSNNKREHEYSNQAFYASEITN